jgi:formate dehydrogenase major subunit
MPPPISRRRFFHGSALRMGGALTVTALGVDLKPAIAAARALKISRTTQTRSVCPYCAVGCSVVIHTLGDTARNVKPSVVHIEGDPDSPINRGTLCSKGISLKQFVVNDRRLTRPLYRAPGAAEWTVISWEDAFEKMARRIKETRERGFIEKDEQGRIVNRLANTVMIGGCTDTNEVNYLIGKLRFALGVTAYENQSRL